MPFFLGKVGTNSKSQLVQGMDGFNKPVHRNCYHTKVSKPCTGGKPIVKNSRPIISRKMYFILCGYGTEITLTTVTAIKINKVFHYNLIFRSYIIFEVWRKPNQKLATVSLSLIMF
jgi:hypothetical protein